MSITLNGFLRDPYNNYLPDTYIAFTAVKNNASTLKGVTAEIQTDANGEYTITVPFGTYDIKVKQKGTKSYQTIAQDVRINESTTGSTLNAVIQESMAEGEATPDVVLQIESLKQDIIDLRDETYTLRDEVVGIQIDLQASVDTIDQYDTRLTNLENEIGTLVGMDDVTITSPVNGEVLSFNGSVWVNSDVGSLLPALSIADITDLQTALDGKSDTGHTHDIVDVTGLQSSLDGKSNTGHGHSTNDISDIQSGATDGQMLIFDGATDSWIPSNYNANLEMSDLTNVDDSSIGDGQVLRWDGTNYVPYTIPITGGGGDGSGVQYFDDLIDVSVDDAVTGEFVYYNGATFSTIEVDIPESTNDLSDVGIDNPQNGHTLRYNSVTSRFENVPFPDANINSLNDIADVNIYNVTSNQVLQYDTTTSKFINKTLPQANINSLGGTSISSPQSGQFIRRTGVIWENVFVQISDVTNLQGTLDDKSELGHVHPISEVTNLQTELDGKAPNIHNHSISQVTNLQTELDGKSDTGHTHDIVDVTGLQTALDGKSDVGHGHVIADVTGLQSNLDTLQTNIDGKTDIGHTHTLADVTDVDITTPSNNQYLKYDSPNGEWINTTIVVDDVSGLEQELDTKANSNHTHIIDDIDQLQIELDAKSNTGHSHVMADITDLAPALDDKADAIHSHAIADVTDLQNELDSIYVELSSKTDTGHTHAIVDVTGLQTALDGKSDVGHGHDISDVNLLQSNLDTLQTNIDGKTDIGHSHDIADVQLLQDALDSKTDIGHSHVIADVTGLQIELNSLDDKIDAEVSTVQGQLDNYELRDTIDLRGYDTINNDSIIRYSEAAESYISSELLEVFEHEYSFGFTPSENFQIEPIYDNGSRRYGIQISGNDVTVIDGLTGVSNTLTVSPFGSNGFDVFYIDENFTIINKHSSGVTYQYFDIYYTKTLEKVYSDHEFTDGVGDISSFGDYLYITAARTVCNVFSVNNKESIVGTFDWDNVSNQMPKFKNMVMLSESRALVSAATDVQDVELDTYLFWEITFSNPFTVDNVVPISNLQNSLENEFDTITDSGKRKHIKRQSLESFYYNKESNVLTWSFSTNYDPYNDNSYNGSYIQFIDPEDFTSNGFIFDHYYVNTYDDSEQAETFTSKQYFSYSNDLSKQYVYKTVDDTTDGFTLTTYDASGELLSDRSIDKDSYGVTGSGGVNQDIDTLTPIFEDRNGIYVYHYNNSDEDIPQTVIRFGRLEKEFSSVVLPSYVSVNSANIEKSLSDLTDVDTTGITSGQVLQFDGTNFVAATVSSGTSTINELSDVDTSGLVTDNILKYDGTKWLASSVDYSEITNTPSLFSGSYNDLTDSPSIPSSVNDLTDIDTTGVTDGQVLVYNDNSGIFEAVTISSGGASTIDDLTDVNISGITTGQILHWDGTTFVPVDKPDGSGTTPTLLGELSNVDTTGQTTNDVLKYNGTSWLASNVDYSEITNTPSLFSGSYNDLTDKPTLFSESYDDLTDKPTFANVATSGDYADLINTPVQVENISDLSDVQTSGAVTDNVLKYDGTSWLPASISYNELSDTPTLFSGDYADLTNTPSLFSGSYNDLTDKPTLFSESYNDLTDKPQLFSGSYDDLSNKPSIPSGLSDLSNVSVNNPEATEVLRFDGFAWLASNVDYSEITNTPTLPDLLGDLSDVNTTGISTGQVLKYDGTNFVPENDEPQYDLKSEPTISSGSVTLDLSTPSSFVVTMDQDITTLTFSDAPSDRFVVFSIAFIQDSTGGYEVTWPSEVQGTPAQPNADPDTVTILSFATFDGGTTIYQSGA